MQKHIFLILVYLMLNGIHLIGQDHFTDFLIAAPEDAELLSTNYVTPLVKGLGYAANSGWYNTAKTHSMGFDLIATVTAALIPTRAHFTEFIQSEYQDLELLSPIDNMVPTVFGSEDIDPQYLVTSSGESFQGPHGNSLEKEFGFEAVLVPMAQLGIGVIPNLDVKFRFMPRVEFDEDFEAKLWGVGILHRINNYFPSGDELLIDLALFGGYTHTDTEIDVSGTFPGDDQLGVQGLNSWIIEGLVSYDLSAFTFYGGLGYHRVNSDLKLLGSYEVGNEVLTDPIDASTSYSSVKATVGLRIKLLIFTLHGEYSYNDYSMLNAGFGLNVN